MLNTILHIGFLIGIPFLTYYLCRKFKLFNWMGAVVVCYIFGILAANIGLIRVDLKLNETIMGIAVPFAIIQLLLSSDFGVWRKIAAGAGLSFALMLVAVVVTSAMGFFLFRGKLGTDAASISGMLVGIYTGATANMAAVSKALGREDLFGIVNLYEVFCGSIYLLFLMTIAQKFYGLFLRPKKDIYQQDETYTDPSKQPVSLRGVLGSIGISILILGTGFGSSFLIYGEINFAYVVACITVLAVLASFVPKIRELKGSYASGDYFLLVFGTAAGLMTNFSDFTGSRIEIGLYTAFVLYVSLAIHIVLARLCKVDRDTAIITAVASIMSAPFVPAVARSMKNTAIILPGIASGIIGTAAGNILGIALAKLLEGL